MRSYSADINYFFGDLYLILIALSEFFKKTISVAKDEGVVEIIAMRAMYKNGSEANNEFLFSQSIFTFRKLCWRK